MKGRQLHRGGTSSRARLASVFRALSDPTRLAIYELIRRGGEGKYDEEQLENSISKIAANFHVSLSTVSHHIKELRNAGLVRCVKRGQTIYCSPNTEAQDEVERFFRGVKG